MAGRELLLEARASILKSLPRLAAKVRLSARRERRASMSSGRAAPDRLSDLAGTDHAAAVMKRSTVAAKWPHQSFLATAGHKP